LGELPWCPSRKRVELIWIEKSGGEKMAKAVLGVRKSRLMRMASFRSRRSGIRKWQKIWPKLKMPLP